MAQGTAHPRFAAAVAPHRAARGRQPVPMSVPIRSLPPISFPDELPVSARRDEIAAAIAAHQVVIVSGETGSGKTTQLPKICLALGRGARKLIGHTQPRRIAASSVARRIAQEGTAQRRGDARMAPAVRGRVNDARTGCAQALAQQRQHQ